MTYEDSAAWRARLSDQSIFAPTDQRTDGFIRRFARKPLPACKRNHRANTRLLQRFLMDQIIPDSIR